MNAIERSLVTTTESKTKLEDVWEVLQIQTPHFKFELQYIAKVHPKNVYDTGHLFVGNLENPCLSITFNLPGVRTINSRFADIDISVAKLNKIKNLKDCILYDNGGEGSFSKEMLKAVIKEIKKSFPYIHQLKLYDTSYIPCDGDSHTLDLLFYNIALYKKTWYEQNFNAYFIPKDTFIKYKCAIETYANEETKKSFPWEKFYMQVGEPFRDKMEEYELMYKSAKTFPEFFIKLNKSIPKNEKCKFFKTWLEDFMQDSMNIPNHRTWYIDLYSIQKGGKTRRIRYAKNKYNH